MFLDVYQNNLFELHLFIIVLKLLAYDFDIDSFQK